MSPSAGSPATRGDGHRRQADLAAYVLDLVAAATGGAAEAEVMVASGTLALTRFANSFIHQNVADTADRIRLRLHLDGRTAASGTTVPSPDGLRTLVEQTVTAARLRPVDPSWPGLSPPTPPTGEGNYDPATAEASPADRASVVRSFVDASNGLTTAGYCRTTDAVVVFANSAGHSLPGRYTSASADAIARTPSSDGVARIAAVSLDEVDGAALGASAAAKARAGADPTDLPPGRYEVVLEPSPVGDILAFQSIYGYNARAVIEGRSFVAIGEQQFDRAITLADEPLGPRAVGLPFDVEGTPCRPLELVRDGRTAALAHDRRTAKVLHAVSTGHAVVGGERMGAIPRHLSLRPGAGTDLVAEVERGLLVADFWYTRVLDPRTLVVTGLTRNGVWRIEDGKITHPVRNLRFTQSYVDAFAPGAVLGIGAQTQSMPHIWLDTAATVAPAVRLAEWNFTGGAQG